MSNRSLREVFADFLIRFDPDRNLEKGNKQVDRAKLQLNSLDKITDRVSRGLGALGVAIGGVAMVRQFAGFVSNTVRIGDELDKTSQQLGITTSELQSLRHAAEISGAGTERMNVALSQLSQKLFMANTTGGETAQLFRRLGMQFRDEATGGVRPLQDVMGDLADVLQRTENSTERVGIVMQLFGETGRFLLPMLLNGSEGLARLRGEFDELGGGMDQGAIRATVELNDNITRLRLRFLSLRSAIAVRVLPVIDRFVQRGDAVIRWAKELLANTNLLKGAIVAFGATMGTVAVATAASWGPIVLTVASVAAAILALTLLVEDLYGTFGDPESDSVTKRFITWAVGAERVNTVIREINQSVEDLKNALASVAGFFGIRVGEEGTDRRRANVAGWGAWGATERAIASPFLAWEGVVQSSRGEAPTLSHTDQEELRMIREQRRTESLQAATRAQQSDELFETSFPELLEAGPSGPVRSLPMSVPGPAPLAPQTVMPISTIPMSVQRESRANVSQNVEVRNEQTVNFNGITDTDEMMRGMEDVARRSERRMAREIESVLTTGDQ